jgi:hypothetical protein
MNLYTLKNIKQSTDRYKLFVFPTTTDQLINSIEWFEEQNIRSLDFGKELARFIAGLQDHSYINIEVIEFIKRLLDLYGTGTNGTGADAVAIYNLGILFEPTLELNPSKLLKDLSKSFPLIILWDQTYNDINFLHWASQENIIYFDFTDTNIKTLKNAI